MRKNNTLSPLFYVCMTLTMLSFPHLTNAAGINCKALPSWSNGNPKVNLHHVFCGEINRKGSAVGYHANPKGQKPNTYVSHRGGQSANSAGIYQWRNIELMIKGKTVQKPVSSMFPNKCSQNQIVKSIQYAATHVVKNCSNPSWAKCGPSAPSSGNRNGYCIGNNGRAFTIATAQNSSGKINTGFPVN